MGAAPEVAAADPVLVVAADPVVVVAADPVVVARRRIRGART